MAALVDDAYGSDSEASTSSSSSCESFEEKLTANQTGNEQHSTYGNQSTKESAQVARVSQEETENASTNPSQINTSHQIIDDVNNRSVAHAVLQPHVVSDSISITSSSVTHCPSQQLQPSHPVVDSHSQAQALGLDTNTWNHLDKASRKQLLEMSNTTIPDGISQNINRKRRREEENIPQMLELSAHQLQGSWNAMDYIQAQGHGDEKRTIKAQVWNPAAGQAQTVYQPSRVQKHKHQINHLAAVWQQQEQNLQAQAATNRKTKAQTWGKYGW